ncbi:RecB-like helicase [Sulfurovum sp. zt1-1]|uniref:DNA 3'-5' helicase n=1 Tax=Sulfurovum zhangzhouensis TaxID=3019067 RepID=A0ABT7QZP8_9BACT|nr:RecB-like helicase [Sulfurovum zhangzhouensis]MDM5272305.1 RecB-like helicase [Sulfurovum zhangzhouensis]
MSFKPFLAYSASAGSGKTFALSVRYISLLFMGESPSSILAATFTNKAASEMRQRVVDSLRNLERDEAFLNAICEQTELSREELLDKQPEVLAKFLASISHIVTLDSFFSSILRAAALEIGLEPDFVTKEQGDDALERHFLNEVQAQGLLSSLVKLAMDIEDKRFSKIFDLMQGFYTVDPLLPEVQKIQHSVQSVEEHCESLRLEMMKALKDAGSADRCIKQFETQSIKELFGKKLFENEMLGEHSWFKKSINNEIEEVYARLKEALKLWGKSKEQVVLYNLFKIYDYYKNATIANAKFSGILSFDDLTYFTYRLLHESISSEFLYFKIDAKFKHILLDEFQDTSTLQFLLLKPLIDEIFAGQGQSEFKSFFYVGDTKQSLYRFRGGVEELFDKVAEHYGITIEPMDTNYRSCRHVVEQVNRWFEPTMTGYIPQKSRSGAKEGFVEVVESDEVIDEAVKQAQNLIQLGVDVDDIAFLVSTNKDGQQLQEACEYAGIDTLLKTSSSLKTLPKIATLVAMMEYLYLGDRIDAEALMIRINKSLDDIDLNWYSPLMQPLKILDRLVREFGYFEEDKNILKLLEFAGSFGDIPTFIKEFKSSSIGVAEHSVHGANIMTIHGSKGLEFGYVIVLDKLTRPNSDKSPLIFHYDENLSVEEILYRISGRDHFDEHYARLIASRKLSEIKDRKNVLYVALTRAVEGMIIIRKEKDSIFDEVGVSPMKIGEIKVSQPVFDIQKKEKKSHLVRLSHYGTQEILKEQEDEEKDLQAILFGSALHYTLEMMVRFDLSSLSKALISMQNRYGQQLDMHHAVQIEARIKMLIVHEGFQKLLQGAQVSKERAFAYDGELKQVDLLLEYEDSCLVIDYKSSKKYDLKHHVQVQGYKKALAKLMRKPTKGLILYLLEDAIELIEV